MSSTPPPKDSDDAPGSANGQVSAAATEQPEPAPTTAATGTQDSDVPPEPDQDSHIEGPPGTRARLTFPVVGIGASAGGLEALEGLTQRLSADRMAFVVVQHLAPGHVSLLTDILARGTGLRVRTVEQGMHLEPGTIYVAPPAVEVTLSGELLQVESTADSRRPRHTIDGFFRSLARAGGPLAIGVVLSGSGTDGTLGLKAIKDEGGITFAQEPSSARQSSMPQAAIDAGCADFSLTPAEIGDELMRLSAHPYVGRTRAAALVDHDSLGKIFTLLRVNFGVDFALYKQSTIERRIGRRIALHKLQKTDDYLTFLGAETHEIRALYNDLLIGVTSFFRDAEPFEALRNIIFPRLFENRSTDTPIRLWVAGCATGEEAYSVAITLLEFLGDRARAYSIHIFATDIDDEALSRARLAIYPSNIEMDVSPERLLRYFSRTDQGYQVTRQVRDLVVFARHNLGKDPPFSRLDLVTCRNVLIYMQMPLQKKVLRIFHYALNPDSYLLLGTSESVGDAADRFALIDRRLKVYAKKNIPAKAVFDFSFAGRVANDDDGASGHIDHRPMVSVSQIADRKVIEKYAPPGVIVDDRLDVVQFRGRIGPYLEPAPGLATLNLLKLARPELLVELRTCVNRVLTDGLPTSAPPVPFRGDDGARAVVLDVMPLPDAAGRKCLLVLFNEALPSKMGELADRRETVGEPDSRVVELERELATNKGYLQSTIEELEAANEELQSSNEELQSSNEELQSTNEELETSKEELQSTNEELATVNDELHTRMAQLSVANDDLQNLLLNGSSAIVIVGADLRIRRFSSSAEKLLSLIPGDVGRPIAYLRNVMSAREIEQTAAEAIASVALREQRVRCIDGFWYQMKMVPYVTADQMIRGLVVEFARTIPPAANAVDELPPIARDLLSTLSCPVMLVDWQLRFVWANRAFFEAFELGPAILGRPVAEAWGSAKDPAELWVFLQELVDGAPARDVLIEHPFGRRTESPMRLSGKLVPSGVERSVLAVVFMYEVGAAANATT